ncbi:hypothetical protein LIER_40641 [Lithospermum erythrorhizon]|uniref:Uncharacterized protein n=1 Tax=Lithospermum erythrorhizon TaxID=34254 RepID=A0AAV3QYU2_LITER
MAYRNPPQPSPPPTVVVEQHPPPTEEEVKQPQPLKLDEIQENPKYSKSFYAKVTAIKSPYDTKVSYFNHAAINESLNINPPSSHQGKSAVVCKLSKKQQMLKEMRHVLVGKFSLGRPTITLVRIVTLHYHIGGVHILSS